MSDVRGQAVDATSRLADHRQYRLDVLANPFGPPDRVLDALANIDHLVTPPDDLIETLRLRLADRARVSPNWIVLANGIDELYAMIVRWRSEHGPIVLFPPSDPALETWIEQHGVQVERVPRTAAFALPVTAQQTERLPRGSTAIVMSPNDPTGTVATVQETVRLTRQTNVVVIDERHAAYSPRTLLPLAREFENLIILDTFETWAGLPSLPLAWAVAPPHLARQIAARTRPTGIARGSVLGALATLDAIDEVQASVRRVMIEKGRLFRQIRKLNMISPRTASWANFLLCRIERGTADFFVPRLAERGIHVHTVQNPDLPNHLRVSAVSTDATNALKQALIDIALDL